MNTSKSALRKHIREMKRQFTNEELEELSLPVMSRLLAHPAVTEAKTILMYYSLPDEVCTHDTVNRLVQAGKTVLLPRVTGDTDMELRIYTAPADLAAGHYGIMEPTGEVYTDYGRIDVAVVPGMAFDAQGHRLGRGKGYYDRFLSGVRAQGGDAGPRPFVGLCFHCQLQDALPAEPWDERMTHICTDREWLCL